MNAIVTINKRAKQLKKSHPGTAWKTLIKRASAEYRGKIKKPAKRKVKSIGSPKKNKRPSHVLAMHANDHGLTIPAAKHFLKTEYERKLSYALLWRDQSKLKSDKKHWQKEITKYRSLLRQILS